MTTQGDVEYHNATTRTRLAPGTSGQFLKTLGSGANPAWATPGGWLLVETLLTTSGTSVTSATLPTDSDLFMVVFENVHASEPGGDTPSLTMTGINNHLSIRGTTVTLTADAIIAGFGAFDDNSINGVLYVPRLAADGLIQIIGSISYMTSGDVKSYLIGANASSTFTSFTFSVTGLGGGTFSVGAIHIYSLQQ